MNIDEVGRTEHGNKELVALFGEKVFSFPKPSTLIQYFLKTMTSSESVILDFFAGSGSTAHAVMQQNAEDGGNRRFILVQLPEATDNPEFPKISDITRERVRRAGTKIKAEVGLTGQDLDVGFRAFKLGASNFRNWDVETDTLLAEDLEAFVDNINTNADDDGIVYEILLKAGIRLDTDLQKVSIAGADVTLAMDGLVAVSANRAITQEFIDGVLALEPPVQQLYLLDSGFGDNDSLKVNARHQFAARRSDSDPDKDDALRTV
ncbi:site-specific DNA-methyltransferase [Arthrobacter sp. SDTb3-6]|nr:site-specific DNA-methyltransferase [Arthrobacter sp. SDTb3-6]